MTRKEYESRNAFAEALAAETDQREQARRAAELLCRHGRTYARIQEAVCNGVDWINGLSNEANDKRQTRHEQWCEKREQQLEKRIRAIVAGLGAGFGVVFDGDPRGATVKIKLPSGRTNDWAKEGYCVPTA